MSDLRDDQWFTEVFDSHGSAFSLKITEKLLDVQSPYQHLEVYATETYGNLMVLDGCVMLTDRDNFLYHEMIAHPALFTHQDPKRVVIIGGGDCGTLKEVLRHPGVEKVTQIDIDEGGAFRKVHFFPRFDFSSFKNKNQPALAAYIRQWTSRQMPGNRPRHL